jgi:Ca-dependent carbohydrate-binding module xylan-binding
MRTCSRALVVAGIIIATAGLPGLAADDKDTITIELKNFTFKVPDNVKELFGYNETDEKLFFLTNGPAEATVKVPAEADYEITIKASCDSAQNERAKFKFSVDGEAVGKETLLTADEAKDYKLTAKLKAGERKLAIEFTNDLYKENEYDRNLYIHGMSLKKK